jgi:hypothetical protein
MLTLPLVTYFKEESQVSIDPWKDHLLAQLI